MLDLSGALSPLVDVLPLSVALDVMREQRARAERQEIVNVYMGNVVRMLAGGDAKSLYEVLGEYDELRRARKADGARDVERAHDQANAAILALERARKGAPQHG